MQHADNPEGQTSIGTDSLDISSCMLRPGGYPVLNTFLPAFEVTCPL
jgi:hypothetical protein